MGGSSSSRPPPITRRSPRDGQVSLHGARVSESNPVTQDAAIGGVIEQNHGAATCLGVEDGEVLSKGFQLGVKGPVRDAHVLACGDVLLVHRQFVADIFRQRPVDHMHPADVDAAPPQVRDELQVLEPAEAVHPGRQMAGGEVPDRPR